MHSGQHYRSCNLCEAMCGIVIELDDNQIRSIKGDKEDPFSRGHICPKAIGLKDLYEDPERVRTPLEKQADGQWREISWTDALDKVANGIRSIQSRYGADSFGLYAGNPNVHNTGTMLMSGPVFRALGTRSKFSATSVDQLPHHLVAWKLFGHQLRIPVPDIDHCDHLLMFGANPVASNGSIMTVPDVKKRLKAVAKRGQLVVIDPRRTETAALASQHHFVRPGSDVLVLLAMLHELYAQDGVQPGRASAWLDTDPDSLRQQFSPYTPERVAPLCGIAAADIRTLVRDFLAADAPVLYGRMGVSVQGFGALCQYLIMLFNILSGRLDETGGMMFSTPAADVTAQAGRGNMGRWHSRVRGLPEFGGELPVSVLAEEILTPGDGQIRGMLLVAGNPVLSTPNGEQLDKAFADLEFMAAIDFYINESNRHANIILPPVSPLEREHYDVIFHLLAVRNTARYAPALFEKPANAKHDWEILLGLWDRLQPPKSVTEKAKRYALKQSGPRGLLALMLRIGPYGGGMNPLKGLTLGQLKKAPHGIDFGPLKPVLPQALKHRDKKIHLEASFFLADLERVETHFFAQTHKTPEFTLIGRRHVRSNNSWLHNSHRLVKGKPRCTALLHPDDAKRLQLDFASGNAPARLRVSSRVGSVELDAEITDDIMPGVISIPHGWGHDKDGTSWSTARAHAGVSVNRLTDEQNVDALSGNAVLNGVPVTVEKLAS